MAYFFCKRPRGARRYARPERAPLTLKRQRGFYNAHIPSRDLRKLCELDASGERTPEMAVRKLGLPARAHDRILKVARTVADMDHKEQVRHSRVASP